MDATRVFYILELLPRSCSTNCASTMKRTLIVEVSHVNESEYLVKIVADILLVSSNVIEALSTTGRIFLDANSSLPLHNIGSIMLQII